MSNSILTNEILTYILGEKGNVIDIYTKEKTNLSLDSECLKEIGNIFFDINTRQFKVQFNFEHNEIYTQASLEKSKNSRIENQVIKESLVINSVDINSELIDPPRI